MVWISGITHFQWKPLQFLFNAQQIAMIIDCVAQDWSTILVELLRKMRLHSASYSIIEVCGLQYDELVLCYFICRKCAYCC